MDTYKAIKQIISILHNIKEDGNSSYKWYSLKKEDCDFSHVTILTNAFYARIAIKNFIESNSNIFDLYGIGVNRDGDITYKMYPVIIQE